MEYNFAEKPSLEELTHHGVPGMKWGVRKDRDSSSGPTRKEARKEIAAVGKTARQTIKESRNAKTASERKAAAKKYETEVLKKIKSPEFKEAYNKANTMSKGETAVHILLAGPLAALTIPTVRAGYAQNRRLGPGFELAAAQTVLKELRNA